MDFCVTCHGSIIMVRPRTAEAREWLAEHTDGQWWGGALAVEPRYFEPLAEGIAEAGFTIGGAA
jgi:hypothetical protein